MNLHIGSSFSLAKLIFPGWPAAPVGIDDDVWGVSGVKSVLFFKRDG